MPALCQGAVSCGVTLPLRGSLHWERKGVEVFLLVTVYSEMCQGDSGCLLPSF